MRKVKNSAEEFIKMLLYILLNEIIINLNALN